jgi:serine-type D-Ala-D-Ala carboxypeptidase/endopeptidase (penicillin-binding protein 4)
MVRTRSLITLILLIALAAVVPSASVTAVQRDRRTAATPVPSPTPFPSPSPTPQLNPDAPELSPAELEPKFRAATSTKTLAELQGRIIEILRKPELAAAIVGIKVVSLDTGRTLFEENASKLLRPASNMKVYTVATALDRLSPDFRFTTSIYAPAQPDSSGVIRGDLTIYGRGDPSLAARFNNGDYFKGINDLAAKIAAAGVKRVEGDLVGDESYFIGPKYGAGWAWEDLTWYYGAEISPLTINDNALDLFVKPGLEVGKPAVVTTGPPDPLLTIVNEVVTSQKGTRRQISVYRELGEDTLRIAGSIPIDDRGYTGGIGISHPALLFIYVLRSSLAQRGITITGKSRVTGNINLPPATPTETPSGNSHAGPSVPAPVEIATYLSPPFSVIAAQTLKPSQNLYTELILRTLGKVVPLATPPAPRQTSEELGIEAVKGFLKTVGIPAEGLNLNDGSGLSRDDMVTADSTVQLLTFMSRHRFANAFRDALPIAGVDGTLRNRMKGTAAENNVRAKTGSLSSAASLGGYVTTATGEKLVFTVMVNNYPDGVEPRIVCIDPIAVLLASFAGKSQ